MKFLKNNKIFLLIIFIIYNVSCGKPEGEFAVKRFKDDTYRKIAGKLEIEKGERVRWIYKFNGNPGDYKIGVMILMKKISWIDVNKRSDYLDNSKNIIYGEIYGLSAGDYRIVLTDIGNNNEILADIPFMIYEDEKEE